MCMITPQRFATSAKVIVHVAEHLGVRLPASPPPLEPSTTHNCWPSRADTWALTSNRTECEKGTKNEAKKPSSPGIDQTPLGLNSVRKSPNNAAHVAKNPSNAAKRHHHHLSSMNESKEPQLSQRTAGTLTSLHITGTSTTALVDAQQRACQEPSPRTAPAETRRFSARFAHQGLLELVAACSAETTNSTCGISTVFCTICIVGTRLRRTTGG